MIRRVTTYDGALLEEAHPEVHDVISPEVARTMTAMLEEVIQFGTGVQAKALGRPPGGKPVRRRTTPTPGLWASRHSSRAEFGWASMTNRFRGEKGNWRARGAPDLAGIHERARSTEQPAIDFANVVPLEQQAREHQVNVDTPDTAPTEDEPPAPKVKPPVPTPPIKTSTAPSTSGCFTAVIAPAVWCVLLRYIF